MIYLLKSQARTTNMINVLLIEDNATARMVEEMNFQQFNCMVDIASSGKEAIAIANKKAYQLILMDIGLGDMDGFNVAKEIRAHSIKNRQTPIVALTAHSSEEYQAQAKAANINGYYVKPLTTEITQEILKKYLVKH